jgi:predicted nucleic acid-binding protein
MILLDTNVISEMMRERPEPAVSAWLDKQPEEELWTASVVLAELLSGIDLMPAGRKQRVLRNAVEGMIAEDFRGRILNFDLPAARYYGQILSFRQGMGRRIREMDAQIAAIAKVHGAELATRNIPDFEHCGVSLVNPWL